MFCDAIKKIWLAAAGSIMSDEGEVVSLRTDYFCSLMSWNIAENWK